MLLTAMFFRYGMETRLNNFVVLYVYIVIHKCILDLRKKNNKVERMKRKSIQNIYELESWWKAWI